ncbi:putative ABC-type phosphate transporter [Helianthus anomalus]
MDRFAIQLMGFFFMTIFMFVLAIPYHHWTKDKNRIGFSCSLSEFPLPSLIFFLANFGPYSTTFVVPTEIFSARLHSTCHGISAVAGKAAAIAGAYGFLCASESTYPKKTNTSYPAGIGIRYILIILAVVYALGLSFTFLVPERNGQSFKEMLVENEEEREFGSFGPYNCRSEKRKAMTIDEGYSIPMRRPEEVIQQACCKEFKNVDERCQCEAVKQLFQEALQMVKQQQLVPILDSQRQKIQKLKQRAQILPNVCNFQSKRCEIETITTTITNSNMESEFSYNNEHIG